VRSSFTFYRIVVEQEKHREGGWHFHAAIHCLPMDCFVSQHKKGLETLSKSFRVHTSTMYVNGE
jgi:hypothetical protein